MANSDTKNLTFDQRFNLVCYETNVSKSAENPRFKTPYRTLEDIYEVLVSTLLKYNITYREQSVEIVKTQMGDMLQIKATISDALSDEKIDYSYSQPLFYPIEGSKSDPIQLYGAALTYARRYFLSGIFMVRCDNKDLDSFKDKPQFGTSVPQVQPQAQPQAQPQRPENFPLQESTPAQTPKSRILTVGGYTRDNVILGIFNSKTREELEPWYKIVVGFTRDTELQEIYKAKFSQFKK